MSKLRKMALTVAAMAALAVGGAAFAQAQNDSGATNPAHRSSGNAAASDTDPGQNADAKGPDRAEGTGEQAGSASASENEGHGHESGDAPSGHEAEDGD